MRIAGNARAQMLVTVLALSAAGCGGDSDGQGCVDLTGGESFTITLKDNACVPSCFAARASQRLQLVNEDEVLHSFTLNGTPIGVDVAPTERLDLDPVTGVVGTYTLICRYHTP